MLRCGLTKALITLGCSIKQLARTACCHQTISTLAGTRLQPSLTVILTFSRDARSSNQRADVSIDRNEINCLHLTVYQPQAAFDIRIILADSVFVFSHQTLL